ncbi:MAG: tagaturonate reductase [Bacilli bacterium]
MVTPMLLSPSLAPNEVRSLPERVIQIGEGNFLGGFFDWLIHQLNQRGHFNGRIVVVAPRRSGAQNIRKRNAQGGLFTVYMRGIMDGQEIDQEKFEAGQPQGSFPGKLTAYLYHRFMHFRGSDDAGMTILPCELIDDNGGRLREIVIQHARDWCLPDAFMHWVKHANRFCNTLVDRIVTGIPDQIQQEEIFCRLGYEDSLLTVCEPFHLFVIEDPGMLARQWPFQDIGLNVRYVCDVKPYRERKVRILNGAHTAMAALCYAADFRTVQQAMDDHAFALFVRRVVYDEIIPSMNGESVSLADFGRVTIDRFCNPHIEHRLSDIVVNGLSKIRVRLVPTIRDYAERYGRAPRLLTLALAATLLFYRDRAVDGKVVHDDGPLVRRIQDLWLEREGADLQETMQRLLADAVVWGYDLNEIGDLPHQAADHVREIERDGIRAYVNKLMGLAMGAPLA